MVRRRHGQVAFVKQLASKTPKVIGMHDDPAAAL